MRKGTKMNKRDFLLRFVLARASTVGVSQFSSYDVIYDAGKAWDAIEAKELLHPQATDSPTPFAKVDPDDEIPF